MTWFALVSNNASAYAHIYMILLTCFRQSNYIRLGREFVQGERGTLWPSDPWLVREDFPLVSRNQDFVIVAAQP